MLTSLQSRASYLSQGFGDNDWEVPPDDWLIMPRQALATHMEKHNKILHQIGRPALYFRQNGCSCDVVINHTRLSKLQHLGAVWAGDSEELTLHVKFGSGSHIGVNWTIKEVSRNGGERPWIGKPTESFCRVFCTPPEEWTHYRTIDVPTMWQWTQICRLCAQNCMVFIQYFLCQFHLRTQWQDSRGQKEIKYEQRYWKNTSKEEDCQAAVKQQRMRILLQKHVNCNETWSDIVDKCIADQNGQLFLCSDSSFDKHLFLR